MAQRLVVLLVALGIDGPNLLLSRLADNASASSSAFSAFAKAVNSPSPLFLLGIGRGEPHRVGDEQEM